MNNILVVNINWLGDAVFSTPVFKALKATYPQSRVACLCVPRVKEVLQYCPYIDKILIYDEKGRHRFPWSKWSLISQIRADKFDAAFILHRSMTRSLLVFLAGIPLRIGFGKVQRLLTHPVDADAQGIHRCDYYLKALEGYGIKVADRLCELRLDLDDIQTVNAKLKRQGVALDENYVVLNTGGNWDLKRWPHESFGALAQCLTADLGLKVVFSGADKDYETCQRLARGLGKKAIVMAGQTTVGESLALYKRALAVISSDSGPLHLAHSVGGNVIGIYGPTRVDITGPRGSGRCEIIFNDVGCNKAPCYHLDCTNNVCMQATTVDDVLKAFKRIQP